MRKSRFSEEQIAMALRQCEAGTPAAEICRKPGLTEATSTAGGSGTGPRGERVAGASAGAGREPQSQGLLADPNLGEVIVRLQRAS